MGELSRERARVHRPAAAAALFNTYSSGTTGRPKGIRRELASGAAIAQTTQIARTVLGIEPGTRTACSHRDGRQADGDTARNPG